MLRSISVVLFVGMVASSSGCIDLYVTCEIPPEACLPPPTPVAEVPVAEVPVAEVPEPSPPEAEQRPEPPRFPSYRDQEATANGASVGIEPTIWKCFRVEREADPELEGTLIIEFEVGDDGTAIPPVEPDTTWAASDGFTSCVQDAIVDHYWPEPGRYVKTYHLR
jgi:hypothetical protein